PGGFVAGRRPPQRRPGVTPIMQAMNAAPFIPYVRHIPFDPRFPQIPQGRAQRQTIGRTDPEGGKIWHRAPSLPPARWHDTRPNREAWPPSWSKGMIGKPLAMKRGRLARWAAGA